jgi:hypothetical protein
LSGQGGPFRTDPDAVIAAMTAAWGDAYDLGWADDAYRAARLDGTGELLSGTTPDELHVAIQADWTLRKPR